GNYGRRLCGFLGGRRLLRRATGREQDGKRAVLHLRKRRSSQLFAFSTDFSTASTAASIDPEHGARSRGAEPCMKGTSVEPGQLTPPRRPVWGSIETSSMRSGLASASGSGTSAAIMSPQIGSAAAAPERRAARLSS